MLARIKAFISRFYFDLGIHAIFGLGVIAIWDTREDHSLGIILGPFHVSLNMKPAV